MNNIQRSLVSIVVAKHPTPWRVDRDWGYEVLDAKGQRVAMFMRPEEAHEAVALAVEFDLEELRLVEQLKNATEAISEGNHVRL